MTSARQLAANRLNARRSTGPRTITGKSRSRRNALKHGLTATTVVHDLEEAEAYRLFHDRLKRRYRPRCTVEDELVGRLASLLWRLRRANAIEAGLFAMHIPPRMPTRPAIVRTGTQLMLVEQEGVASTSIHPLPELAETFLKLSNRSGDAFDRLRRYEVTLWRQAAQILLLLGHAPTPISSSENSGEN
jgi:hypothetical protein